MDSGTGSAHAEALDAWGGVFQEPPGPHVVVAVGGGPVVKNDLVENEPAVLVVKVVHLHQVDPVENDVFGRIHGDDGDKNPQQRCDGTHGSPP